MKANFSQCNNCFLLWYSLDLLQELGGLVSALFVNRSNNEKSLFQPK